MGDCEVEGIDEWIVEVIYGCIGIDFGYKIFYIVNGLYVRIGSVDGGSRRSVVIYGEGKCYYRIVFGGGS